MSNISEKILAAVKTLPDQQAAEVLDFVEFLQTKSSKEQEDKRKKAWATLDKHKGAYDGKPFNREELYDRS